MFCLEFVVFVYFCCKRSGDYTRYKCVMLSFIVRGESSVGVMLLMFYQSSISGYGDLCRAGPTEISTPVKTV